MIRCSKYINEAGSWTARALLSVLVISFFNTSSRSQTPVQKNAIDQSVSELFERSFGKSYCTKDSKATVGLWTIAEDKSPVSGQATRRIYEEILARLLSLRPKCVDFLDSAGIAVIASHLQKSGALEENGDNVLAALGQEHQNVDFVAFPNLYSQSGNVLLTLRIVERATGKTRALTSPISLPKSLTGEEATDSALSLDVAIKAAAQELLRSAGNVSEIQAGGIFFEGTEAQPSAGRFIREQLTSALVESGSNPITNKKIKLRGISIEPADPEQVRAEDLSATSLARKANAYELSGRYWIRGEVIQLKLSLTDPDGGTVGWNGRIRIGEFKGMELKPQNSATFSAPLPKLNYAFQVTSPKGTAPVYRPGQELRLMIRLGKPAYVYCFYVDSKGGIQTILPLPARLAGGRSNKLVPQKLLLIPDPALDKFAFRFNSDTVGEELVSCFASEHDIGAKLPSTLFPDKPATIPFLTIDKLRQIFAKIPGEQVAESLVTITVTQ